MDDNLNKLEKKKDLNLVDKKIFSNLKVENEDNIINNNSKKEIVFSNKKKRFNDNLKCKMKYSEIFEYIQKNDEKNNYYNEYYCNLLLMPSVIDITNKYPTLSKLSYCYQINEKSKLIYSISNKFEKNLKSLKVIEQNYIINVFTRAAAFLQKENNYFYAMNYIKKSQEIVQKNQTKISKDRKDKIQNYFNDMDKNIKKYMQEKKNTFNNDDYITNKKLTNISDIINSTFELKDNIELNNNEDNNKDNNNKEYFYLISKEWLIKLKRFIVSFINNINKRKDFIEEAFDLDYVYASFFNEEDKKKNIIKNYPPYPGPINNFYIASYKDAWEDGVNQDENDFIRKGMKLNEDYMLINSKNWNSLKIIFDSTNEIKRTKNNLDLIEIKFILFDKRINNKNGNINLLKEKYIQINKNSTFKQLKEKILNSINSFFRNKNKQEICFYLLDKDKKDLLIEIISSFVIKIEMYESLYIEKIEFKDDDNLNVFFTKYDKNKHILIVEIINNNDINFLIQIEKDYKCSECGQKILKLNKKYNCKYCHFSLFCSQKCINNSVEHRKLDDYLKRIMEPKFVLLDFLSIEFSSILNSGTTNGRRGLCNTGNTSCSNSVIQCLSNTEDLTKYFLKKSFIIEINTGNYFGSRGELSNMYYKLIYQLWNNNKNNPLDLTEFYKTNYFYSQENQDAHEYLLKLLNKLHEDLNRITIKNYLQLEEKLREETDEIASKRWWDYNKSREDSIINDLFQGQYKTIIKCSNCGKESIKYEEFLTLGLPIPTKKSQIQIKLLTNNGNFIDINVKVNENTEMKDFILKSIKYLDKNNYLNYMKNIKIKDNLFNFNNTEVPENILYNNIQVIEFNKNYKMINIYNPCYKNINNTYNNKNFKEIPFDNYNFVDFTKKKNSELILFEKDVNSNLDNYINVYVYPITEIEKEAMFNIVRKDKIISLPVIISIKKNEPLKELQKLVIRKFNKILHEQAQNYENSIEICYPHFNDKWENFKIPEGKCPLCEKNFDKNTKYCPLFDSYNRNLSISSFINEKNKNKPLILFAKSLYYNKNKNLYRGIELQFKKKNEIDLKKNLTLYDALDSLREKEVLDGENMWYCSKCNNQEKAEKEMEIYRTPYYLIIQIKRFKLKKGTKIIANKNETFIEYKEVLNLKDFVLGADKNKSIYDLYGVIIHKKTNNGHYFSFCKNRGRWLLYDDDEIFGIEKPIDKDAYLLFYKRRSFK